MENDLKGTKFILCVTKKQTVKTSYVRHYADKSTEIQICWMCGEKGETALHIISDFKKLQQREYKWHHDKVV